MKKYPIGLALSLAFCSLPAIQAADLVKDPVTELHLQPGFAAELLYKVDKGKYGSWIAMAFDDSTLRHPSIESTPLAREELVQRIGERIQGGLRPSRHLCA